jgi:hypothetical protein
MTIFRCSCIKYHQKHYRPCLIGVFFNKKCTYQGIGFLHKYYKYSLLDFFYATFVSYQLFKRIFCSQIVPIGSR